MKRRLFNILTVVSLLLGIANAGIWIRSIWVSDHVTFWRNPLSPGAMPNGPHRIDFWKGSILIGWWCERDTFLSPYTGYEGEAEIEVLKERQRVYGTTRQLVNNGQWKMEWVSHPMEAHSSLYGPESLYGCGAPEISVVWDCFWIYAATSILPLVWLYRKVRSDREAKRVDLTAR
jgi:hypothetical protein